MDVGGYRTYVWEFLQLDAEELPVGLIDTWLREGFTRIVSVTKRFPPFEASETVQTVDGVQLVPLAVVAADKVEAVSGPYGMLQWMGHAEAQRKFHEWSGAGSTVERPLVWSRYGGDLFVWPAPSGVHDLVVTGWRDPDYGWLDTSGGVPDLPEPLHEPLLSWVMHRAYTWDDDPERAAQELGAYQSGVDAVVGAMVSEVPTGPMVLHGGRPNVSALPFEPNWVFD